jgi:uncharacterized protein (DUF488 family)
MAKSVSMPTIWTIGHSTRSIEDLIDLLKAYGIQLLVDVRRYPASRRYPHFNAANLFSSLGAEGIGYRHAPDLGGRRPSKPDSINCGWRNAGFRGYADYMQTKEFQRACEELTAPARPERAQTHPVPRTVIMCAEAVPWRCHRFLISDALVVRGWQVLHILSRARTEPHVLTSFAQLSDDRLIYPAETGHPSLF